MINVLSAALLDLNSWLFTLRTVVRWKCWEPCIESFHFSPNVTVIPVHSYCSSLPVPFPHFAVLLFSYFLHCTGYLTHNMEQFGSGLITVVHGPTHWPSQRLTHMKLHPVTWSNCGYHPCLKNVFTRTTLHTWHYSRRPPASTHISHWVTNNVTCWSSQAVISREHSRFLCPKPQ
jgi:hypothetical protein